MNQIVIHILDKSIIYTYEDKLTIIKSGIKYGKVDNEEIFIKNINKVNKHYKINSKIIGDNITVIINDLYNNHDQVYLYDLLKELQYNKIEFIKEKELLHNNIIIDNFTCRIFIDNKYLVVSKEIIDNNFIEYLISKYKITDIIRVIDINKEFDKKITNRIVYFYVNPLLLVIDNLKKHEKSKRIIEQDKYY